MKYLKILLALIIFSSCSKDDDSVKDFREENDLEIQAYITDNNLTAEKSSSGLYYVIDNPGTGEAPVINDRVKVIYKGYLTDGTTFDESSEEGASFTLQNLISGWMEGLTYFKEGGSGKLLIPAHLAYGSKGSGNIPAGSVLIFDIELIYVNYATENDEQIQNYLSDNDITAEKTETGLYYTINTIGTGEQPSSTSNVTFTYTGYFLDDQVFDESTDNVNFDLNALIPGFAEGITYLNEGGSGTFFIPAHLAYGNNGTFNIPGGSVLIFNVELISVN